MDIKSTFLIGEFNDEVYMEQPQSYVIKEQEDKVYHLIKALHVDKYFQACSLESTVSEPSLHVNTQVTNDFLVAYLC